MTTSITIIQDRAAWPLWEWNINYLFTANSITAH